MLAIIFSNQGLRSTHGHRPSHEEKEVYRNPWLANIYGDNNKNWRPSINFNPLVFGKDIGDGLSTSRQ